MRKSPTSISTRDYEGIIIDLLDDIVSAEHKAKLLVDRLDSISKRPTLRVIDLDLYLWSVAAISIVSCALGTLLGYIVRGLI